MIFVTRGQASPHYQLTEEQGSSGEPYWLIWEGGTVIATCDTATYAQAVLSALNFQRTLIAAKTLMLAEGPEQVGLN